MNKWESVPFSVAVADHSGGNIKTQQRDYLSVGRFPIVDQGKELIGGYTNDETCLCHSELPVIVFGDHTRCFKYVDFPFGMGADGVKVLRPKVEIDVKYLYHYLCQLQLPSGGYDRHFKYLKRCNVLFPTLPKEQKRIASILDEAEQVRSRRMDAIVKLNILKKAIFYDMFGDPTTNPKGWVKQKLHDVLSMPLRNGLSPSNSGNIKAKVLTLSAVTGDCFDSTAWKESTFNFVPPPNKAVSVNDLLICRGNGNVQLVGKAFFPTVEMPDVTFPDTIIAARVSFGKVNDKFFQFVWNSNAVRIQIESLARTTNGTYKVNQSMLEDVTFISPEITLQKEFSRRITAVEEIETLHRTSRVELDAFFASLQHRAFRGEL